MTQSQLEEEHQGCAYSGGDGRPRRCPACCPSSHLQHPGEPGSLQSATVALHLFPAPGHVCQCGAVLPRSHDVDGTRLSLVFSPRRGRPALRRFLHHCQWELQQFRGTRHRRLLPEGHERHRCGVHALPLGRGRPFGRRRHTQRLVCPRTPRHRQLHCHGPERRHEDSQRSPGCVRSPRERRELHVHGCELDSEVLLWTGPEQLRLS